ncbi:MAG: SRPBCC domain-containing protein [Rhodospirillaceae bacterium]
MRSTTVRRVICAPRSLVYQTMLDPAALARWKVPDNMTLEVHEFEAREGGRLRISLTYDDRSRHGKTRAHTDTYHGQFARLIDDELIVETDEFETSAPGMQGTMTITVRLADIEEGTEVIATHENLPPDLPLADNELGWRMALDKLASVVQQRYSELQWKSSEQPQKQA